MADGQLVSVFIIHPASIFSNCQPQLLRRHTSHQISWIVNGIMRTQFHVSTITQLNYVQ